MECKDEEVQEEEHDELTVDFSKQSLKRIERANSEQQLADVLILDNNEIQRLENVETYENLKKLSLVNNQLVRMLGVSHLVYLQVLDLSSNSLLTIEGLKDLVDLRELNLSKNRIKTIEHLHNNLKLEKIDLSENNIMHISDLSYLYKLKELYLHGNRISILKNCEKNMPESVEILTLSNNLLTDLNEISHLVHLVSLKELSIVNNPCLDFSQDQKFNYRPFIKNWCSSLIVLDNCPLDDIECLKAEWLYSQGRGRSFRPGEHAALIEYLISVCPREEREDAETEDVKKLKLILSKAQLHQQQLRDQLSTGKFNTPENFKNSPKKKSSTSDRMVTSLNETATRDSKSSSVLMTRSLDLGAIRNSSKILRSDPSQTPLQTSTTFIPIPDTLVSPDVGHSMCPPQRGPSSVSSRTSRSSSRNSPYSTPESRRKASTTALRNKQDDGAQSGSSGKPGKLFNSKSSFPLSRSHSARGVTSPGRKGAGTRDSERNCRETSEEEDSEVLAMKLSAIQFRVNQKRQMQHASSKKLQFAEKEPVVVFKNKYMDAALTKGEAWNAAICIQRRWRGYRARNLNREVVSGCKDIQMSRMQDYIMRMMCEMEATRIALEENRKLVVLQMQAINALWKKMTALQPVVNLTDDKMSIQNLVETCTSLNKQVEALQTMMKTIKSPGTSIPIATQTEIVAVHTPQGEIKDSFPYTPKVQPDPVSLENRPCIDSTGVEIENRLESTSNSENISQTGIIKTVSDTTITIRDADISTASGSLGDKEGTLFNETLTKPNVKLSEGNPEAVSSPSETECEKLS